MKSNYLVCYDIKDETRLNRVFRAVSGIGINLQYSVFYCRLDWEELLELKQKLINLIDKNEDDIRIYPLPSNPKVLAIGQASKIPEGVQIFLDANTIS